MIRWFVPAALTLTTLAALMPAGELTPAQRGEQALEGRAFLPPFWTMEAYLQAWHFWPEGPRTAPQPYDQAFLEHYGLHPAPYANDRYPMGMRTSTFLGRQGLTDDCMLCHGGSIAGQSYVGLGNTALDMQALFEDLNAASGRAPKTPLVFTNVRGTSEAGSMAVYLLGYREPDLSLHPFQELGLRENLCEDVPAWWLLKKKNTMYYTGSISARSVRSLMQFMLIPVNSAHKFQQEEATFRDIQAFIQSLQPPRYPFPIDPALAHSGERVFHEHCARCHGTYGKEWTYPNKIVPIDVIGTDRTRYDGFSATFWEHYNQSWFAHEHSGWLADDYPSQATAGYQAPPLDGIWATAPYFHNGSVPTVYNVLNSRTRPRIFTRSFRTGKEEYDPVKLGWKVQVLDAGPDPALPAFERRKVYDTSQPGRGNGGHTFGDDLTEPERMEVIEYLKTL